MTAARQLFEDAALRGRQLLAHDRNKQDAPRPPGRPRDQRAEDRRVRQRLAHCDDLPKPRHGEPINGQGRPSASGHTIEHRQSRAAWAAFPASRRGHRGGPEKCEPSAPSGGEGFTIASERFPRARGGRPSRAAPTYDEGRCSPAPPGRSRYPRRRRPAVAGFRPASSTPRTGG